MLEHEDGQQGFSLLELLVYIAIVGVLMAAAVPKYQQAMAMANTSRIQADLHSLDMAIVMYESQTGRLPANLQPDLEPYLVDIKDIKPPQGKCILRSGDILDITVQSYVLAEDCSQALCQDQPVNAFGRPDGAKS